MNFLSNYRRVEKHVKIRDKMTLLVSVNQIIYGKNTVTVRQQMPGDHSTS